jgi:diguanylate cyclase (GGDEF)-like protein
VQAPPTPIDETQRLRALSTLCVLDTLPEERFDRITRLAARAFDVPIALVSLVDRDRQWFKSRQGLQACETSRDVSFCGHAILNEGPLVVADALQDPRFFDNPLVLGDPHIRFYAGQPIHGPDGSRVGTLCLIDGEPREFSAEDAALLADLSAMVERELSLMGRASTDELTRLSNRRGFTMVAAQVLALCRRNHQPAVVIGIDLDQFKSVNDGHGHEAGDEVLRSFAKMLHAHFRSSDVVARFGGDEFAVLCSGTTSDELAGSLERLRREFGASALARDYPALSFSAGSADFRPESSDTIDDLLRASDARMYVAKSESKRRARQSR